MTNHTPGPFSVVNGKLFRDGATARTEVRPVEATRALNELLAALQDIANASWQTNIQFAIDTARAALAKAGG